ncbi:hypothetical protein ScPMuIL_012702 [Solemya velum]
MALNTGTTALNEYERKELQQKQHYFFQSELQSMARELPGKYQQRLPYDLLSGLASALLDGTVFAITKSLQEVQQLEERNLSSQRIKMANEHKAQKHEMQKKHKEMLLSCQNKPHNRHLVEAQVKREQEAIETRCDEEIRKKDMKIIMELDQKVMDQQVVLERAGVPGFFVTNNKQDLTLQKYLLEFIVRLSSMELPG